MWNWDRFYWPSNRRRLDPICVGWWQRTGRTFLWIMFRDPHTSWWELRIWAEARISRKDYVSGWGFYRWKTGWEYFSGHCAWVLWKLILIMLLGFFGGISEKCLIFWLLLIWWNFSIFNYMPDVLTKNSAKSKIYSAMNSWRYHCHLSKMRKSQKRW